MKTYATASANTSTRHRTYRSTTRFVEVAAEIAAGRTPRETVEAVSAWVRESLAYEPGATDVSTNARSALELGRGVCQDFVHVALALLRAAGIPARYASGYLHPDVDAAVDAAVTGQSHAWLEAWTGSWQRIDPTNGAAGRRGARARRARARLRRRHAAEGRVQRSRRRGRATCGSRSAAWPDPVVGRSPAQRFRMDRPAAAGSVVSRRHGRERGGGSARLREHDARRRGAALARAGRGAGAARTARGAAALDRGGRRRAARERELSRGLAPPAGRRL